MGVFLQFTENTLTTRIRNLAGNLGKKKLQNLKPIT